MNTENQSIKTEQTIQANELVALVVDDEPLVGAMLSKMVARCGFTANLAANCIDTLEMAAQRKYDLILIDVNLPDGNGIDLIPSIRKNQPEIEIITMTGDNPIDVEAKARDHKVSYHLVKPFDFNELTSILSHIANKINKFQNVINQ